MRAEGEGFWASWLKVARGIGLIVSVVDQEA